MKWIYMLVILFCPFVGSAQDETFEDSEEVEVHDFDSETIDDLTESEAEGEQESSGPKTHMLVNPKDLPSSNQYRKEPVQAKSFDDANWRKIVGEETYEETPPEPVDFNWNANDFKIEGDFVKPIAYLIIIAVLLVLVYQVARKFTLGRKAAKGAFRRLDADNVDDIQALDIPQLLNEALREGNLKLAVRFYYLYLLKNLHNAGHIRWEKDKTNRDYLNELFRSGSYYDEVRILTRNYEEIWYGDYAFSDDALKQLLTRFKSINDKLIPGREA